MDKVRLVVTHDPNHSALGRKAYDLETTKKSDVAAYDLLKKISSILIAVKETTALWYHPPAHLMQSHADFFLYVMNHKASSDETDEARHVVEINLREFTIEARLKDDAGRTMVFEPKRLDRSSLIELLFKAEAFLSNSSDLRLVKTHEPSSIARHEAKQSLINLNKN